MRRAGERGFAAIELSVGIALLVVPVALLVLSLPEWSSRQSLARLAARDAARVIGLRGWCDRDAGERVVDEIAGGAGLPAGSLRVGFDCVPAAPLPRSGTVTAQVTVDLPAVAVPLIGSVPLGAFTAVHREPVDPYGSRP